MMQSSEFIKSYEKLRELGEGASGKTYLVRASHLPEHIYALKVLSNGNQTQDQVRSFEKEWKVLESLNHPHLAKIFQYGNANGHLFFTTEFVEGSSFVKACEKLDWNAIFILMVQVAWALDYLHAQGFIHRDLKPDNILVGKLFESGSSHSQERLHLKIIDFGLACTLEDAKQSREIVGTLPYIAPEVLKKEAYDHRADLFSLGVILYQVAVGRLPVEVRGQYANYIQRLSEQAIDLQVLQEWGAPRGVIQVIDLLLKLNPSERMQSAKQIIEILNQEENESFPLEVPLSQMSGAAKPIKKTTFALSEEDKQLSPDLLVKKMRDLSQEGKKEEAIQVADFYYPKVLQWQDEGEIANFYAMAVHLRIHQGDFSKAEELYADLQKHPVLQGKEVLEKELIGIDLSYRQSQMLQAQEKINRISPHLIQKGRPDQLARFYNLCALIDKEGKRWSEAVANFEKAASCAREAKRPDQELALLMNAAATSFDQGKWAEAYHLYEKSLEIAERLNHKALLANIYNNLGNLYLIFGRWTEANYSLYQSLDLAREQNNKPLIAHNLNLLTQSEDGKGNWEKVKALIGEALQFSETLGDSPAILQAQLENAYFEWNQKNIVACKGLIALLKQKAKKLGHEFYIHQALWLEAKCELLHESPDENLVSSILEKLKKEAEEHQLSRTLWQVWADEALLLKKLGRMEKAKIAYFQALEVLNQIQEKIPEEFRESFWRDRKKEKIKRALFELEKQNELNLERDESVKFEFVSEKKFKGEIVMTIEENKTENKQVSATLSFQKWVEINRRLLTQSQVNLILDEIMDDAIGMSDAERGFVIYSESQELDVKSCRNIDGKTLHGEEEKFSYTIAQEVMRKGESVLIVDAQKDERFSQAKSVLSLKIRSVLCVPLRAGLKTVGLVYLDNRFREGVFKPEHLPIIEALSDQASLALEHARLHEENRQKIEELKKSKETIEKLNLSLEKDLDQTSANLLAVKESLKRQNEEISLRYTYDKIIGESNKIKQVLKKLDRIVDSNMSVFIHGESGTGKELIAQAIHFNGARKDKPFIAENCTALPETLLESELFGHVQGSFTGADKNKIGLFELANGGTLFLDEVGDMPLSMQAKLLRVLQEGEVRQVGGKDFRKVDVRIITASNKDLKQLVAEGKFRQDLYYRINVIQLDLPPLRERREDVPLLLNYFMEQETAKMGLPPPKISKEAMKILINYDWPGNIRELLNEVTRFVSLRDASVDVASLSPHIIEKTEQSDHQIGQKGLDFLISLVEKKAIVDAMNKARGNKVKAAKILKIGRRTLYAKLDLYKIDSELGKTAFLMTKHSSSKLAS